MLAIHRASARTRHRFAALAAAAIAAVALTFASASPALAHDQLVGTAIETNASTGAAESIVLSFNNEVLSAGVEIIVTGPDGTDASGGEPVVAGRDVTQPLAASLASGDYDIAWRVASSDGHPIQGELLLTVSESGAATLGDPAHDHADEAHAGEAHADDEPGNHEHADATVTSADTSADAGVSGATIALVVIVAVAGIVAAVAVILGARRRRTLATSARTDDASIERTSTGS